MGTTVYIRLSTGFSWVIFGGSGSSKLCIDHPLYFVFG
jgi:hypothetical protein